jgi:hypothetical protein
LKLFILSLAIVAGITLSGCTGDHSPTVDPDGRVTAPNVLPR